MYIHPVQIISIYYYGEYREHHCCSEYFPTIPIVVSLLVMYIFILLSVHVISMGIIIDQHHY